MLADLFFCLNCIIILMIPIAIIWICSYSFLGKWKIILAIFFIIASHYLLTIPLGSPDESFFRDISIIDCRDSRLYLVLLGIDMVLGFLGYYTGQSWANPAPTVTELFPGPIISTGIAIIFYFVSHAGWILTISDAASCIRS